MNLVIIKDMKIKLYITVLLFNFVYANLSGQVHVEVNKKGFKHSKSGYKEAVNSIKKADFYFQQEQPGAYQIALDGYLVAYEYNQNNPELNYKIGACYLYSVEKSRALFFLQKAYKAKPDVSPDITYLMGWASQLNYELDNAINYFNEFKKKNVEFSKKSKWNPNLLVDKKIRECEVAKELIKNPVRAFIDNLGSNVNSKYADYAPLISTDASMLIFTSKREETTKGALDPNTFQYYEDIYVSYYNDKTGWGKAVNLRSLNTTGHDASVGLSPDGQILYTYRGMPNGTIYESRLNGENWSTPKELNKHINTKYQEISASITYDGKYLYFVSDRPKDDFGTLTLGGYDIFVSEKQNNGSWGPAKNVGIPINTEYNEEGVFLHPNGVTMYFSSNREGSMGGYDIFYSELDENNNWETPVNIGYPINTTDDDVFFVVAGNNRYAYYSSAREGGYGSQDVYRITFLGPEKITVLGSEDILIAGSNTSMQPEINPEPIIIKKSGLTIMKGNILDAATKKTVMASIEVIDIENNEVITTLSSNSSTGRYLVSLPFGRNYAINVNSDEYLFYSENINIEDLNYQEINKDILLSKVEIGSVIVLKNVFFELETSDMLKSSYPELDKVIDLLNQYANIKVEIGGHTDNIKSLKFSTELSEARAQTVMNYLISKGIDKNRLSYKGYSYLYPIVDNDATSRNENNRMEMKIVSLK
jgi:outer membrane protein OmpA-like peptidoglycan-associated protein/tetratricopeptide (TPR) repeat protein